MENAGFVFAAFGIIWAVVFGYVLFLVNRQSKLNRQVKAIEDSRSGKDRA
jgi:CcmD family protein